MEPGEPRSAQGAIVAGAEVSPSQIQELHVVADRLVVAPEALACERRLKSAAGGGRRDHVAPHARQLG